MKITSTTFTWKLLSTLIIVGVVIAATIVFVAIKLQSNHHRSNNTARVPLIPRDDGGFQARMQRDKDRVAGLAKLLNFSIYDPQFSYGARKNVLFWISLFLAVMIEFQMINNVATSTHTLMAALQMEC
ncbi:hypothetical protein ACFE04_010386 [Oxalis oulophora]